ncbi:cytochrome bc1 complex diheme cytochrome c subunit [Nocardioides panacis]|uniref:cytochrome bc1 complex diheme cytochrome c subunit n=1 Tax=Nocardioides panacis TaxID=2849501 RepID=UPI0020B2691C
MRFLSARLSSKRRSPFAGLVVLVMGLLITGGLYAVLSPASAQTSEADQSTVSQGKALFLVGCASCHGKNGEGIVTKRGTQYGPPLAGVGAAAVDFQVGTGRMPMARPGVQAQRKKVVYTPEEITALAAYVASLGPGPAIPDKSAYDPTGASNADVVRGGQFFKTNCTACHNFAASGGALPGGKFAPSLKGVSDKHIYEAMLTGPQQMPVFSNGVVTPDEKRQIIAYLNSIENDPKYGGASLGALGPVSEGLTAWLVGIGALVGFAVWIASHSVRSKKGVKA